MTSVISFYHVKGVLEKLLEYGERDANFDEILACLEEGKITPKEVDRLFELTEHALGSLTVLSDILERVTDAIHGRDWMEDWVAAGEENAAE